ncbi:hypothetical protein GCM10022243_18800 [Saccharothrix violaceirubra]|uniref:Deoxyribonuclease NucA/NucB domain-containing protein n=1 Tax=Saccharothrix violaceirubra TaxID=413306 RepID=A0A7W7T270_9PSEU|nr:hypothetical protein [Saccharothrix violaceirubra]MBB4965213.1 hypothetical protein [Saccharothrix violaceirubra]
MWNSRIRRASTAVISAALIVLGGLPVAAHASPADETESAEVYVIEDGETARAVASAADPGAAAKAAGIAPLPQVGDEAVRSEVAVSAAEESYVVDSERFDRGAKPEDPYQYADRDQCRSNEKSDRYQGWIKNRYSYCKVELVYVPVVSCSIFPPRCAVRDEYLAWHTVVGEGKIGSYRADSFDRWARFTIHVSPVTIIGRFGTSGARLAVGMECEGRYRDPVPRTPRAACRTGEENGRDDTVPGWRANGEATIELVSEADKPAAERTAQIAIGIFKPRINLSWQPLGRRNWRMPEGGMRFDSAWYASQATAEQLGSVFDRARSGMSYRLGDPKVAGLAAHIDDARRNPDGTLPPASGKRLPGATADDPIRRLARRAGQAQADRYQDNIDLTRNGYCRTGMPPKPPTGSFDCDEYPFASTCEGAGRAKHEGAQYKDAWSVRWVDSGQNQEGGRRLGRWYANDRLLDTDPFFVTTP